MQHSASVHGPVCPLLCWYKIKNLWKSLKIVDIRSNDVFRIYGTTGILKNIQIYSRLHHIASVHGPVCNTARLYTAPCAPHGLFTRQCRIDEGIELRSAVHTGQCGTHGAVWYTRGRVQKQCGIKLLSIWVPDVWQSQSGPG